jgi:hypothetical protein
MILKDRIIATRAREKPGPRNQDLETQDERKTR